MRRVFLIVLDSFGIGEMEDAEAYGDKGTNTIGSVSESSFFHVPNLQKLGLFNIEGIKCGKSLVVWTDFCPCLLNWCTPSPAIRSEAWETLSAAYSVAELSSA